MRDAVVADAEATAELHIEHLPVGLFPRLGRRFVARWHRAFVNSPHAVSLVAVEPVPGDGERITGFVIGATDRRAFREELLTWHRTSLLVRGVGALAVRPRLLSHFLRTRLRAYLRRLAPSRPTVSVPPGAIEPAPVAELTAVAVVPTSRRSGSGQALTEEFLARCACSGASRVELVTTTDPPGSVEFYLRTGWTALRRLPARDGQELQRFVRWTDRAEEGLT